MTASRTRTWLEYMQILCLAVCGAGVVMFSPPNKVAMTATEITGAALIVVSAFVFVSATMIRFAEWLNAKMKSNR